jgi:hypothetical protein
MLSGLVKTAFRGFFEVILWIILLLCVIGGGMYGASMGGKYSDGHPILGGLFGLIGGFLTIIIFGGFIATILNMDENLENMRMKMNNSPGLNLSNLSPISPIGTIKEERKCKKCGKSFDSGYSGCPHCGSSEFV